MTVSPEQYASGRERLLEVLRQWELLEGEKGDNRFGSWLEQIQRHGWTRKDVCRLIWEILDQNPNKLSESSLDQLAEFESALTGFCDSKCIIRFPNDPADEAQLAEFVRRNQWR